MGDDMMGPIAFMTGIALLIVLLLGCPILIAGFFLAIIAIGGLLIGALVLVAKLWESGKTGKIAAVGILTPLALLVVRIVQQPDETIEYLPTIDPGLVMALLGLEVVGVVAILWGSTTWCKLKYVLSRWRLEREFYRIKYDVTRILVRQVAQIQQLPGFEKSRLEYHSSWPHGTWWEITLGDRDPDGEDEIEIKVAPGGMQRSYYYDKGNGVLKFESDYSKSTRSIPFCTLMQPHFVATKSRSHQYVIFESDGLDLKAFEECVIAELEKLKNTTPKVSRRRKTPSW